MEVLIIMREGNDKVTTIKAKGFWLIPYLNINIGNAQLIEKTITKFNLNGTCTTKQYKYKFLDEVLKDIGKKPLP